VIFFLTALSGFNAINGALKNPQKNFPGKILSYLTHQNPSQAL